MQENTDNVKNPIVVSIIVPVYNTAERLAPLLDSLLAQTIKNYEIILVNDGSTDESPDICQKYQQKYPNIIRYITGKNGGVCAARNKGIEAAQGEWIAFCDSDDLTDPELYRTLYDNALRENADLSCCALLDSGPEEKVISKDFPYEGDTIIKNREDVMNRFFLPLLQGTRTCNGYLVICLFKRSILNEHNIRMPIGVYMFEDELFLLEYLLATQTIVATDQVLYTYLRFDQSACTKFYRGRDDFYREKNWFLRAREFRRIFMKGELEKNYPHLLPGLIFREVYHNVQMISCNPELSLWNRLKEIRKVAKSPAFAELTAIGANPLFRFLVKYVPLALPPACWLKRRKDEFDRSHGRK